ncbi:TauD/TfdA family dioxygenase, partial [Mesorhizobium sp. M1C.F.Ca.ET.195.01.1.1]
MRETTDLPPVQIDIPAAWIGEDMARHPETWLVELEPQDVAELEAAASSLLAGSDDIGGLTKAVFPLPRLGG